MKRLFAAIKIEPDENFLKHYYHLRKALKNDNIKWVEPQNLHLTLKFFGETPVEKISEISKILMHLSSHFTPFFINIAKLGIFGSRYDPRVIWLGLKENEPLKSIGLTILKSLDEAGFPQDRQNFVPHLTVGRIKQLTDKARFQEEVGKYKDVFFQELEVDELILFESILRPNGPQYIPLEKYSLG